MTEDDTSLQAQSPLSQAQNSLDRAARSVAGAQSHPTKVTIRSAWESLDRAEHAVSDAAQFPNEQAVGEIKEWLQDLKQSMKDLITD